MSLEQALALLDDIHVDQPGREATIRRYANNEFVVILKQPSCYHLWEPEDWLDWKAYRRPGPREKVVG